MSRTDLGEAVNRVVAVQQQQQQPGRLGKIPGLTGSSAQQQEYHIQLAGRTVLNAERPQNTTRAY